MTSTRDDNREALEDERREYQYAQQELNRNSRPPLPKDGKIARYCRGQDCPDLTTCDVVYVDRTTGKEVMRYDGADPANTNPYYGARSDKEYLAGRGLDINEMISPDDAVITDGEIKEKFFADPPYDYEGDDFGDDDFLDEIDAPFEDQED